MVVAVRAEAQSLLLVLLGGAVLRISLSDIYLRYVKESMQPYLIAAGAMLVILGVAAFLSDRRRHARHGGPRVAWLLLLPVLAIFIVAPPSLGSYAAERTAAPMAEPEDSTYAELGPDDPGADYVSLTMFDYWGRAIFDEGRSLQGRTIALTGFVTPAPDGSGFYVSRLQIACCAADALPFNVRVVTDEPPPEIDSWIQVVGSYVVNPEMDLDGNTLPAIQAASITPTEAPADPYE